MKKVSIKPKPNSGTKPDAVENWVASREVVEEAEEEMKRLTLDVPVSLHRRIKTQCSARGLKMVEEIRSLLDKHFPATS